jgi:hypothetical protein
VADFSLDENVSERTADVLDELGHDVVTARQLRSKGIDDARQLTLAARFGRTFVTYNHRDFLLLHRAWRLWSHDWSATARAWHAGILILLQPPLLAADRAAHLLDRIVQDGGPVANRFFARSRDAGRQAEG